MKTGTNKDSISAEFDGRMFAALNKIHEVKELYFACTKGIAARVKTGNEQNGLIEYVIVSTDSSGVSVYNSERSRLLYFHNDQRLTIHNNNTVYCFDNLDKIVSEIIDFILA